MADLPDGRRADCEAGGRLSDATRAIATGLQGVLRGSGNLNLTQLRAYAISLVTHGTLRLSTDYRRLRDAGAGARLGAAAAEQGGDAGLAQAGGYHRHFGGGGA